MPPTVEVHGDQVTVITAGAPGPQGTPGAGGAFGSYLSGRRYTARAGIGSNNVPGQNVLKASVNVLDEAVSIGSLVWRCLTAGVALTYRIGVWADSDGRPGALLHDSGALVIPSTVSGQVVYTPGSPIVVATPGRYWFGWVRQSSTGVTVSTSPFRDPNVDLTIDSDPLVSANYGVSKNSVSGALPNPFGTPLLDNQSQGSPLIAFGVA